jgi:MFS family permease
MAAGEEAAAERSGLLGLTRYQWLVIFAAWLGWGFDCFDGLLFNYVSPICVPNLLRLAPGDPATKGLVAYWTGALTSVLLVGWGLGGILFGKLTDRLGRTRTLLLTMLTYALATAACAIAPNLYVLGIFRFVSALGIGGEWAAGAALVAETVPDRKREVAGALLYTSASAGLFLATFVNDLFSRQLEVIARNPNLSWRLIFLTGLVPAAAAIAIRWKVREPERWAHGSEARPARLGELFAPGLRRRTIGGLAMALTALVTWWSCNAFLPMIARYLVDDVVPRPPLPALGPLKVAFVTIATTAFNVGGLVGTLATVPIARRLGRRPMFALYFAISAVGIWITFGWRLEPNVRLYLMGLVGLTVFGVFGAFTFYLPELFPTRLRGTGAGFCYNTGRFVTALFPIGVGVIAQSGTNPLDVIRWVALVPVAGLAAIALGLAEETRGQRLA